MIRVHRIFLREEKEFDSAVKFHLLFFKKIGGLNNFELYVTTLAKLFSSFNLLCTKSLCFYIKRKVLHFVLLFHFACNH